MKIVLFKGSGFISRAIQLQTRSSYSHVGILANNLLYEAWHVGGVRNDRKLEGNYDLYEFKEPLACVDQLQVIDWLEDKIGMPYDFLMVARFLSRRAATKNKKYFCSELVMDAFNTAGIYLLNAQSHYVSPRDIGMSPLLVRVVE